MNNDKLIIGGHEFDSRFILGSGKSLNRQSKMPVHRSLLWQFAVPIPKSRRVFLTIFPKGSLCYPIQVVRELLKNPSALPVLQENWGVEIL